ncbi:hypothetical protein BYT27DRAFT_6544594 [Phlegmacium glaucopus]|nr:hypothetical protein BYT27DRAFT_6544594 [Phlegmacium glaucopus]
MASEVVKVIPDEAAVVAGIVLSAVRSTSEVAKVIPYGTATVTGIVVVEVTVPSEVAKGIPHGTATATGRVRASLEVAKGIPDGTSMVTGRVIIKELAVVSEVTKVSPDGTSMVTSVRGIVIVGVATASLVALALVSAITLGSGMSGVVAERFVTNESNLLASTIGCTDLETARIDLHIG